jgi:hypothetical protein
MKSETRGPALMFLKWTQCHPLFGGAPFRLPEDLLKQAKRKADAEGRTLTSLIADGLRLVIAENRKVTKPKPLVPRVSKAIGGPMPGLDLADLPALQEMDDLEYVRRTNHFK